MGHTLSEWDHVNVYCDNPECNKEITVDVFNYSNNSSPLEDLIAGMEEKGWFYADDFGEHCYCEDCKKTQPKYIEEYGEDTDG